MQTSNPFTEKPQVTKKGLWLTFFFWAVFTLLSAGLLTYADQVPFIFSLIGTILSTLIMLVLMVGVWFVLVQELYQLNWIIKLILHGIASIVFTVAWYYSYLYLFDLFFGIERLGGEFQANQTWVMFSTFIEYVLVFTVVHIIESLKQLRAKEKQTAELKELSRKQEIATLKAQINPHFLFNTLNSINAAVMQQPEEAQEMIARLSEMLRYSLDSFEKEYVPLADEIKFVQTYLGLEKKRLGDRLETEFDIDDQLKQVSIPPMICQPLVENAVKHGISPLEEGGKIMIQITEKENRIHFNIKDTGRGIEDNNKLKERMGIGLKNTSEMLEKRYGASSTLNIQSNQPKGTAVSFSIPIE